MYKSLILFLIYFSTLLHENYALSTLSYLYVLMSHALSNFCDFSDAVTSAWDTFLQCYIYLVNPLALLEAQGKCQLSFARGTYSFPNHITLNCVWNPVDVFINVYEMSN